MTPLFLVDAFTQHPFSGNPAAVCVLPTPGDEHWMRLVAREMNLSETAFLHGQGSEWSLRWFTPAVEVRLCGHATLAAAHILWEQGLANEQQPLAFATLSGRLTATRVGNAVELDFPATPAEAVPEPEGLARALGCKPLWTGRSSLDYLVEVEDEATLRTLHPDLGVLAKLPVRGVIVTARSDSYDFVCRFFAPAAGINEDPVTGSAFCALGPYWQPKLRKADLSVYQGSERGGTAKVCVRGKRVLIAGHAVTMGRVELNE